MQSSEELESQKQLWSNVFSDKNVAINLYKNCTGGDGTFICQSPTYGSKNVQFKSATALGDNFTSDAFSATAKLDDGTERNAFVKVRFVTILK